MAGAGAWSRSGGASPRGGAPARPRWASSGARVARHRQRLRGAPRRAARSPARGSATGCARPARRRAGPGRPGDHALLLAGRERGRGLDVEDRLDARLRALGVLAARAARAREAQLDLARAGRVTERVHANRLARMAAILLDVDGVLHVSGRADPRRAARRSRSCAAQGHRLRFVTNNTTRPRAALADELRGFGIELDDSELQTTAGRRGAGARRQARVRARDGRARRRPRGDRARRRGRRRGPARRGGRDRGDRPRLQLHEPRPRVRRARARRRALLPAQEPVVADVARPAARLGCVRRRARVRGRGRGDRARQAEPGVLRGRARRRSTPSRS